MRKEEVVAKVRSCHAIRLKRLRNTRKNLTQNIRSQADFPNRKQKCLVKFETLQTMLRIHNTGVVYYRVL
jgi:hypothetical protein